MATTSNISIRIDPSLKSEAEGILTELGLTTSQAINLFYRQIILMQGLPFNVTIPKKIPNETTREAMEEKNLASFDTPEELYEDLGIYENTETIKLRRTGTHSELFKM